MSARIKIILLLYFLSVFIILTGAIYPGSFWQLSGNDIIYDQGDVAVGETLEVNKIGLYSGQTEVNVNADMIIKSGSKLKLGNSNNYWILEGSDMSLYQGGTKVLTIK